MYHKAKRLKNSFDPRPAAVCEREIGPEWTYILREAKNYAGLSGRDLAKVLGKNLLVWYDTVYHFQSCDAHGLNALQHLDIPEAGPPLAQCVSTDQAVSETLTPAVGLFLSHMQALHEYLQLGHDATFALDSLTRKWQRLNAAALRTQSPGLAIYLGKAK
jgi:hypothetical protein